ncbi:MAG: hypothetical protein GY913_12750 [Proteobacteria bacterium]|nr:hypothetical protein [Pseudomonadota bacterium]
MKMLFVMLACTGPAGDKDTSDPLTWVVPDDVVVEEIPGLGGDVDLDAIFDDTDLAKFSIEIGEDGWQTLKRERKGDDHEWVEAAFIYDGQRYEPVGVRLKGENSFLPVDEKPSLKIKFDKYVNLSFGDVSELTLNNMSNDYSMMHERVAYRMMREAGVPSVRCSHAELTLNDDDYGTYAVLENVDRDMMKRWVDDPDKQGIMFEVWDVDFYDQYISSFQLEFGEDDRTHLQGVADALEGSGQGSIDDASVYLDYDQFIWFYAVETIIGQYDSYPFANPGDDAHVYVDPGQDRLVWLPHGMDETFYSPDRDPTSVNGIIAKRCLNVNACKQKYYDAVWEAQTIAEEIDLHSYASEVRDQITPMVEDDPNRPYSMDYVEYYQDVMIDFIGDREADLVPFIGERD